MKIRLIGLGKMGLNLALNMKDHKHHVIGYDATESQRTVARNSGLEVAESMEEILHGDEQKIVWLLVPAGAITELVINQLKDSLNKGDVVIDGGNSNFNDSLRRYQLLKDKGISFIDVGTSGGTLGARHGACLMVGGDDEVVKSIEQVFYDVSVEKGYLHVGKAGSGHYVKMVHNGIEYGMMQAIGEGYDLMQHSQFDVDYEAISDVWNHGSIISSALIGYTKDAFNKDAKLNEIAGRIDDSGEGMWMIEEALKQKVSLPVITASLFARFKSKDESMFGEKVVAAMRKEFGGHAVYKKK
ncbi:MAG TPA: decarboxylating 6-phosphogluconate dehydrogenase [Acholeplasma sp.]|nr:decarboxylating 6-phosphogluconate dehydrogenase [Acholeplasma sp.]